MPFVYLYIKITDLMGNWFVLNKLDCQIRDPKKNYENQNASSLGKLATWKYIIAFMRFLLFIGTVFKIFSDYYMTWKKSAVAFS